MVAIKGNSHDNWELPFPVHLRKPEINKICVVGKVPAITKACLRSAAIIPLPEMRKVCHLYARQGRNMCKVEKTLTSITSH